MASYIGWCLEDLAPLIDIWLERVSLFSLIMEASLLWKVVADLPIPPVTDITRGVKVARSTSLTL